MIRLLAVRGGLSSLSLYLQRRRSGSWVAASATPNSTYRPASRSSSSPRRLVVVGVDTKASRLPNMIMSSGRRQPPILQNYGCTSFLACMYTTF